VGWIVIRLTGTNRAVNRRHSLGRHLEAEAEWPVSRQGGAGSLNQPLEARPC